MRNLLVSLLFCCGLIIYDSNAVQHNVFYGNCLEYDNNTVPIYKQDIIMDNPHVIHMPTRPIRRWYNWLSNISFRGRSTTTTTPKPFVSGNIINTTVVFPPHGIQNSRRIKCIKVIDNVQNGYGGSASVVGGGINQNKTEIRLISQPGGKIHSTITIYTEREPLSPQPSSIQTPFGWKVHPNQIPNYQHPSNQYQWRTLHKKK